MNSVTDNDFFDEIFADESGTEQLLDEERWKILVVDDEEDVHAVTRIALDNFSFRNKALEILDAYSAKEARQVVSQHPDIAVVFLDVVMETGSSGLELVDYIRNDLRNQKVRIVLRTGQPGEAPEKQVMERYGIDDYRLKTDLSADNLFSATVAGLRNYESIARNEQRQIDLEERLAVRNDEFQNANRDLGLTKLALERSDLRIFWLTPQGRFIYANNTAAESLGYEPEELLAMTVSDIDSGSRPDDRNEFWKTLKQEKMVAFETDLLSKDCSRCSVIVKSHYVEYEGREYEFRFAVDIMERKIAERALERNRRNLRAILDSVKAGVLLIDPETHTLVDVNRYATDIIGAQREEITGRLCHSFLCPAEKGKCPITDLGQEMDSSEKVLLNSIGQEIPVMKTAKSVRIDGRNLLLETFIDISALKAAEKERDRLRRHFMRSRKMEAIGTLAGGIAHDFNNILAVVLGYTELAMFEAEKDSFMEESLQEVYQAATRAKDLVSQILTFARQSDGDPRPIQVGLIAEEVLKLMRPTTPASIQTSCNVESKSLVNADPSKIQQIFMNLFANALQAMEEDGGTLKVGLADVRLDKEFARLHGDLEPGDYLKITVSDTGVGIPEEVVSNIFDPYFTTKKHGKGAGLGLSVVHGLVKSHCGEILVESRPGTGTVFSVYLPITKKMDEKADLPTGLLPTGNERILVVDDEKSLARMLCKLLQYQGYNVDMRVSSLEALELFKKKSDFFDLVITDMEMPGLTGDKLARAIKKIRPDIPVLLCTGYSDKIDEERAAEIGIDGFLMKPATRDQLVNTVRNLIDVGRS